jgi:enoyl-CoA hydratase/carnithine racemase
MRTEEFKDIRYEKDEQGIVTLTLNTPKRKNALSMYTFFELFWAVDALETDESAYVMIITGAKDPDISDPTKEAFSSGGYFNPSAMDNLSDEIKAQIDQTDIAQAKLTLKMWQCEKPVIIALNGLAVGAGFTMLLSGADLVYASEHAWASAPFIGLGILPELASTYLLPRLVGFHRAKEILYFGERMSAQKLFEIGLVNKVVPHDQLMPFVRDIALKLAPPKGAAKALRLTKRALHQPFIDAIKTALAKENEGLNKAFTTEDFAESLAARLEKRAPSFKGK